MKKGIPEQGVILTEMVDRMLANPPKEMPKEMLNRRTVRKRWIAGQHFALSYFGIPRRIDGNKMGLRRREALGKGYEVME